MYPEGTRVRVLNGDQTRDLGLGTLKGVAVIEVAYGRNPDGELVMYSSKPGQPLQLPPGIDKRQFAVRQIETPEILLDTGETTYGCATWWSPVEDTESKEVE